MSSPLKSHYNQIISVFQVIFMSQNAFISSLFIAMLNDKQLIKAFHCWANMCEDDGRSSKHFFLVFHDSL